MLRVSVLSGETVAELHEEELRPIVDSEKPVRALKHFLAAQVGHSRFRQRLFGEDMTELQDDASLVPPLDLHLVILDFQKLDAATAKAFYLACEQNSIIEVERMLQAPLDPNTRDLAEDPHTGILLPLETGALLLAACHGRLEVVCSLLEAGADKDATTQEGETALHSAARNGHFKVVQALLEAGVDKDAAVDHGRRALHLAACNGHLEVVRLLLETGADKDATTLGGETALHSAALNNHVEVVRFRLEIGLDKDAAGQNGLTALHGAALFGHIFSIASGNGG